MISILDIPVDQLISRISAQLAVNVCDIRNHKEWISQNEAYRQFGKAQVNKWLSSGKITPRKNGNRVEYKYTSLFLLNSI